MRALEADTWRREKVGSAVSAAVFNDGASSGVRTPPSRLSVDSSELDGGTKHVTHSLVATRAC